MKRLSINIGFALLAALTCCNACRQAQAPSSANTQSHVERETAGSASPTGDDTGLNRHPRSIHYSKHARCRMDCRHISESEVQEILADGTINFRKSELNAAPCRKRYALEGETHDRQHVRIIFAPCDDVETVVTVIDLGTEWSCDCN